MSLSVAALIVDNSVVATLAFFVRSECQVGFFLRRCVCRLRVDCGVACLLKPVDGRVEFRGLTHELAVNDLDFGQFGALCQPGFGCAKRGFAFVDIGSLVQVGQFGCGLTKPRGRGADGVRRDCVSRCRADEDHPASERWLR